MRSRTILASLLLIAVCAVAVVGGSSAAGVRATAAVRLQATLEGALRDSGAPGASAAVVDDGELVWSGVAGSRTVGGAPVLPTTRFVTASAGKTVTAAMILRLVDEGAVALGDRLSEYANGIPGARRIRIRNLLEHSSGLPDYLASNAIWRTIQTEPAHAWTRAELFDVLGKGLRFRPGSRARYSNTNYIALGAVIESATGGSITETFRRSLAEPFGLQSSSWDYDASLYDQGARPYLETRDGDLAEGWDDGFVSTDFVGQVWTDGGLATTGLDLATFANALVAGSMLEPRTRRELLRFREQGYGRGIFRDRFGGRRIFGHDGLYEGFTAQHWTEPEERDHDRGADQPPDARRRTRRGRSGSGSRGSALCGRARRGGPWSSRLGHRKTGCGRGRQGAQVRPGDRPRPARALARGEQRVAGAPEDLDGAVDLPQALGAVGEEPLDRGSKAGALAPSGRWRSRRRRPPPRLGRSTGRGERRPSGFERIGGTSGRRSLPLRAAQAHRRRRVARLPVGVHPGGGDREHAAGPAAPRQLAGDPAAHRVAHDRRPLQPASSSATSTASASAGTLASSPGERR